MLVSSLIIINCLLIVMCYSHWKRATTFHELYKELNYEYTTLKYNIAELTKMNESYETVIKFINEDVNYDDYNLLLENHDNSITDEIEDELAEIFNLAKKTTIH